MKSSNGWVKIHRQFLEWEWYDDTNTKILFLHLLLKANHKDKNYRGQIIKRGSLLTGRELLSKETGLSVMQVRTSLTKLKSTNEITIKSNKKGTEIQVVKYNDYQVVTNEVTNKQPTSNQQVTTNKNVKKEKKYREFAHLSLSQTDFEKLNKVYTKEQIDKTLNNIENFRNNKKYKSLYLTALNWLDRDYPQDGKDDYVANVLKQIK
jgi:hypothetical protein